MTLKILQDQSMVMLSGTAGIGQGVAYTTATEDACMTVPGRSAKATNDIHGVAVNVNDTVLLVGALAQTAGSSPSGKIDCLIITIGSRTGPPPSVSPQRVDLEQAFGTKLLVAPVTMQTAPPYLTERASIMLTSDLFPRKAAAASLLCGSIDVAVEAVVKNLAKESIPRRVNVISPGVTDTEAWGASADRQVMLAHIGSGLPVDRVGTSGNLAQGYLLAMTNGFTTGAIIDIEGGDLLQRLTAIGPSTMWIFTWQEMHPS